MRSSSSPSWALVRSRCWCPTFGYFAVCCRGYPHDLHLCMLYLLSPPHPSVSVVADRRFLDEDHVFGAIRSWQAFTPIRSRRSLISRTTQCKNVSSSHSARPLWAHASAESSIFPGYLILLDFNNRVSTSPLHQIAISYPKFVIRPFNIILSASLVTG
ncbi:hypothetical protein F4604DRAFT_1196432 [Suillus subluteus]|nr:hypothetical protein F4604DRAFT_1196432 [Suillus subluteus]